VIRQLIEAAVCAPSAMNCQPWAFVVVREQSELKRISQEARRYILEEIPDDHPLARLKERVADPDTDILHGAPALLIVCATTTDVWAAQDCAMAAENLMLAAHAVGLGSCWIGLAQPWLNLPTSKASLGLEQHYVPAAPIVLGYPTIKPGRPDRRQAEIHWIGD
jgi:nitroreductase